MDVASACAVHGRFDVVRYDRDFVLFVAVGAAKTGMWSLMIGIVFDAGRKEPDFAGVEVEATQTTKAMA